VLETAAVDISFLPMARAVSSLHRLKSRPAELHRLNGGMTLESAESYQCAVAKQQR
jgi:hypothetical protein